MGTALIRCGWCGHSTDPSRCGACRRDPVLPYTQRGTDPEPVLPRAPGRPRADTSRLREAMKALGPHATVEQLAEWLDVSPRTVRRWRDVHGR